MAIRARRSPSGRPGKCVPPREFDPEDQPSQYTGHCAPRKLGLPTFRLIQVDRFDEILLHAVIPEPLGAPTRRLAPFTPALMPRPAVSMKFLWFR
jgi:hypothetical protein